MSELPNSSVVSIGSSAAGALLMVIDATLWQNLEGFLKVASALGICTGIWLGVFWAIRKHQWEVAERKRVQK